LRRRNDEAPRTDHRTDRCRAADVRDRRTDPHRTARAWLVHWQSIEPTVRRYQEAVSLDRVLAEHHGAVAAEPLENCPAGAVTDPKR
jgi:hypothetical protein